MVTLDSAPSRPARARPRSPCAAINAKISARQPPRASWCSTARTSGPLAKTTPTTAITMPEQLPDAGPLPLHQPDAHGHHDAGGRDRRDHTHGADRECPVERDQREHSDHAGCGDRPGHVGPVVVEGPSTTASTRTAPSANMCATPTTAKGRIRRLRSPPKKSAVPHSPLDSSARTVMRYIGGCAHGRCFAAGRDLLGPGSACVVHCAPCASMCRSLRSARS